MFSPNVRMIWTMKERQVLRVNGNQLDAIAPLSRLARPYGPVSC